MSDGKKLFPATRLILLAVMAGAVAGAVAVYVSETTSGNNEPQVPIAATADDASCAAKADNAKALAAVAVGDVAAMLPANPPQSLKGLAFDGPDGKPMTLADRTGKTVLVNLWATWCAPCRAEMPALDALQKEMGSDRFEVVAINVDTGDAEKPKKFLAQTGVATLAQYRDATMGVFEDLKKRGLALGLPVTLLVDDQGCLLANMNGPAEWAGADAKKLIGAALGEEANSK
jgi:thiol-disulfide isomerase/thioredoxin